jgi:N-methylhydantoinase B/oxoprolinase/acetone carboxylase alpha subunit
VSFFTAGGGGYGNPRRRSADALRTDLKEGLITEKGLMDYGVTAEELA